ncbi:hypothetical protein Nmel_018184 [Mimus melanotis]
MVGAPVTLCTAVLSGAWGRGQAPSRHQISSWEIFPVGPVCPSAPKVTFWGQSRKIWRHLPAAPVLLLCWGQVRGVGGGFLSTQRTVGKGNSECLPMSHLVERSHPLNDGAPLKLSPSPYFPFPVPWPFRHGPQGAAAMAYWPHGRRRLPLHRLRDTAR